MRTAAAFHAATEFLPSCAVNNGVYPSVCNLRVLVTVPPSVIFIQALKHALGFREGDRNGQQDPHELLVAVYDALETGLARIHGTEHSHVVRCLYTYFRACQRTSASPALCRSTTFLSGTFQSVFVAMYATIRGHSTLTVGCVFLSR